MPTINEQNNYLNFTPRHVRQGSSESCNLFSLQGKYVHKLKDQGEMMACTVEARYDDTSILKSGIKFIQELI